LIDLYTIELNCSGCVRREQAWLSYQFLRQFCQINRKEQDFKNELPNQHDISLLKP
jgi:hypothetical protein